MKYNNTQEIAYNPAQFQDYDAVQRMRMQLDMANEYTKMKIKEFFYRCKLRLHSDGAEELVGYVVTQGKKYTNRSVARIGDEASGITGRHEHRVLKVFREEQKRLKEEIGSNLIGIKSGKKSWNVNTYIISPIIYDFPDLIKELINKLPEKALQYVINPCHTIVKNIILGIRDIYKTMVNHSSETGEGGSPETVSLKACASHNFFNEKDKSCLFAHTRIPSVGRLSTVKRDKNLKRDVYSGRSKPDPQKSAILAKEGDSMSNEALEKLRDLENAKLNRKQRAANRGSGRMCGPQLVDLKLSISYHFSGNYIHKPEDRIFSKEHTIYLRKRYGL